MLICDPPFGIDETSFHKHYNRDESFVLDGYEVAPNDYYQFSFDWFTQAKRVMKSNASMYVFSGWNNLPDVLNAINDVGFFTINHIIWKYNFGVFTKRKYISSHYHILFLKKEDKAKHIFNLNCRFGMNDRFLDGKSRLNEDIEDVFFIKKEYNKGIVKNKNKLPNALVEKLVLYSSNEGDVVCDFFLGNFTTAFVAKRLNRIPIGFEINKNSYEYFIKEINATLPL